MFHFIVELTLNPLMEYVKYKVVPPILFINQLQTGKLKSNYISNVFSNYSVPPRKVHFQTMVMGRKIISFRF